MPKVRVKEAWYFLLFPLTALDGGDEVEMAREKTPSMRVWKSDS